jgi:hypothetical protein
VQRVLEYRRLEFRRRRDVVQRRQPIALFGQTEQQGEDAFSDVAQLLPFGRNIGDTVYGQL